VAVHGLNGDARSTWTDPASGKLWLRDFLPEKIPNARIMSFGYDSALAFGKSVANLEDFAIDLLDRLRGERRSQRQPNTLVDNGMQSKQWPLLFICHSLGGIVVKKVHHSQLFIAGMLTDMTRPWSSLMNEVNITEIYSILALVLCLWVLLIEARNLLRGE
jgi:hypothetical protein